MRLAPRSVRGRAVVGAAIAMAVFGIALGAASYVLVSTLARSSLSDVLTVRVDDVAIQMADEVPVDADAVDLGDTDARDPVLVQVRTGTAVVAATAGLGAADLCPAEPVAGAEDTVVIDIGGSSGTFLRLVQPVDLGGTPGWVCGAASLASIQRAQSAVLVALAIVLPLLVGGGCLAAWLAVGRALGDVDDLRRQAEDLETGSGEPLRVQPTGDEVERLGITLNRLLDHLRQQSATTRRFVADAGHELRSPLASLRVGLEFGVEEPDDELRARVSDALGDLDRLERLVQDLLALAKADALEVRGPHQRVGLATLVQTCVDTTQRGHPGLVVACRAEQLDVDGDPSALRSMVANLLDNAARHAASRIDVTLVADADTVVLRVDDDGRGIDAADCERVFDRFVRLDEARVRDEGGSGLGLSIVASVAGTHGGSARALPRPGGHVEVRLPRA